MRAPAHSNLVYWLHAQCSLYLKFYPTLETLLPANSVSYAYLLCKLFTVNIAQNKY